MPMPWPFALVTGRPWSSRMTCRRSEDAEDVVLVKGEQGNGLLAFRLFFTGVNGIFDEVRKDDGHVQAEAGSFLRHDDVGRDGNLQLLGSGKIRCQGGIDQRVLAVLAAFRLIERGTDVFNQVQRFLAFMGSDEDP